MWVKRQMCLLPYLYFAVRLEEILDLKAKIACLIYSLFAHKQFLQLLPSYYYQRNKYPNPTLSTSLSMHYVLRSQGSVQNML